MRLKKWHPIIDNASTKEYINIRLDAIVNDLASQASSSPFLLGNNSGISLFWEYLFLYNKSKIYHNYSSRLINSSLDALEHTPMSYLFSSGVSGVLWAFTHLVNIGSIDANLNDLIGVEVHKFLLESSKLDIKQNNYDYFHGGLSALPYLLERSDNEYCRQIIGEIIIELEKVSEKFPEGIAWMEGFHFISDKKKRYNLGMAHGMDSIIIILSKVLEKDIESNRIIPLIQGCVNWIMDKKQETGYAGFFPTSLPSEKPYGSRVSWCYGDVGIAFALLQASEVTKNYIWRDNAIEIALNASYRDIVRSGVKDACFCHGLAGNMHLFNRFYHYTGNEEFKTAALYWLHETLKFYEVNHHFKYYTMDKDGSNPRWEDSYGILEGIAGIGLALIATISDVEPHWDRCFLLS